jgi:hypothetical protein
MKILRCIILCCVVLCCVVLCCVVLCCVVLKLKYIYTYICICIHGHDDVSWTDTGAVAPAVKEGSYWVCICFSYAVCCFHSRIQST